MLVWITGAPGAGKTTLAKKLCALLPHAVLLDGDDLRGWLTPDCDYSDAGRKRHAERVLKAQGATINSATLAVQAIGVFQTPNFNVFADDADDAAAWGSSSRPSQITQTAASSVWNVTAGAGQKTVDVTAIVQEIVSRAGWVSDNHMRFAVPNVGSGTYDIVTATAVEKTYGTQQEATLQVDFSDLPPIENAPEKILVITRGARW